MRTAKDRYQAEPDDHACTEPLEDEDGETYRVCQQPVGTERVIGGGEFPDPDAPPRSPAPGSVAGDGDQQDDPHDSANREGDRWPS